MRAQHGPFKASDGHGEECGVAALFCGFCLQWLSAMRLATAEQDPGLAQDQLDHASPTTTAIDAKANAKARKYQLRPFDGS